MPFRHSKITAISLDLLLLFGFLFSIKPARAADILGCEAVIGKTINVSNNAAVSYSDRQNGNSYQNTTGAITNEIRVIDQSVQPLKLTAQGVVNDQGQTIGGLGEIARSTAKLFRQQGLTQSEAEIASLTAITELVRLESASSMEIVETIKQQAVQAVENNQSQKLIERTGNVSLLTALSGLQATDLASLNLTTAEVAAAKVELTPQADDNFLERIGSIKKAIAESIERPEVKAEVLAAQQQYEADLEQIRTGKQALTSAGDRLKFRFRLENQQDKATEVEVPNAEQITQSGLTGKGSVESIVYRLINSSGKRNAENITPSAGKINIPSGKSLELIVRVTVGKVSETKISALSVNLQTDCGTPKVLQTANLLPKISLDDDELIDPLGQITGCGGDLLPEYQGFSVALYDPDPTDTTGSRVQNITPLTLTELPDDPDNDIPLGIKPNTENSNPFFLTNSDQGNYSFLFDEALNQLDEGKTYILIVSPPENSIYSDRRIRLTIGERRENIVEYTATSLDGKPIRATDGQTTVTGEIVLVRDAERVGLDLAVLDLESNVCDAQEIQINKTGDRATAEPGDVILYRLVIRNLASEAIENVEITDFLPPGFKFEADSVRAEVDESPVNITTTQEGSTVNFSSDLTLDTNQVINLVYAAQVTPNALRGDGQNRAIVNAQRTDNSTIVRDGPAIHDLRIEPGILEDTGILIGRVFVDHNFDGEQQTGEPGVPNAVIFLEDGNRIITDPDGLFSVANILPGTHTGILDLTSIPEYRLAPNLRFSEGNSKSRLVRLEPGGMVRMNFAVTPTASGKEIESKRKTPEQPSQQSGTSPPTATDAPSADH